VPIPKVGDGNSASCVGWQIVTWPDRRVLTNISCPGMADDIVAAPLQSPVCKGLPPQRADSSLLLRLQAGPYGLSNRHAQIAHRRGDSGRHKGLDGSSLAAQSSSFAVTAPKSIPTAAKMNVNEKNRLPVR
jgi:hypothetical protein